MIISIKKLYIQYTLCNKYLLKKTKKQARMRPNLKCLVLTNFQALVCNYLYYC